MSNNVDIGGSIVIDTSSLDKALASVQKLEGILSKASEGMLKSTSAVDKASSDLTKTYTKLVAEYGKTQNYTKAEAAQVRMNNALAKATNSIGSFEAQVRKTNTSSAEQAKFIAQAAQAFDTYTRGVAQSQAQGIGFAKANTELSVSLSQLQRELAGVRAAGSQGIVDVRAIDNAKISFEKAANAVRTSALEDDKKAAALRTLESNLQQVQNAINQYGIRSIEATKAQGGLRRAIADTTIATQNANKAFRGSQLDEFNAKFRNLTSAVIIATGPLGQIAARLTALQGLFNRNAATVAILLSSMTLFGISLSRAKSASIEAERQFYAIDASIASMGMTARVTTQEMFDLGHALADATLLSAKEARDAATALLGFGNLSVDQFERVIITAQGMTSALGGRLRENVKLLGRVMQDPIEAMSDLERRGVRLDTTTQNLITTMVQQGRAMEANNLLLDQLARFEQAARNEANSLAGALDAVSGNIDKFYENTFIASGALDEAKKQTQLFAEAILELSTSDAAVSLGNAFRVTIEAIGNTLNFVIRNLDIFSGLLVVLAASTIPPLISFMGRLLATLLDLSKAKALATRAATAQATSYDSLTRSTVTATTATRGLSAAIAATPWGLVSGIIGGLIYVFSDKIFKTGELSTKIQGLSQDYRELGNVLLTVNNNLAAQELGSAILENQEYRVGIEANIEAIKRQIRINADLRKSIDEEIKQLRFVDRLFEDGANKRRELILSQQAAQREYEKLNKILKDYESGLIDADVALDRLVSGQEDLIETAREAARQQQELTNSLERFNRLTDMTDPKVQNIKKQIDELVNSTIALVAAQDGAFDQDQLDRYLARLNQLRSEYAEALNPTSKRGSTPRAESTSDLDRMIKTFKDAQAEADELSLRVQGLNKAADELVLQRKIEEFADSVSLLSRDHLNRLAESVGIVNARMMQQSEVIDVLRGRYSDLNGEVERYNRILQADEAAKNWRKSQETGIQAIRTKYQELFDTMFDSSDETVLGDLLAAEQAEITKHIQRVQEQYTWAEQTELQRLFNEYQQRKELIRTELAGEEQLIKEHLDRLEAEYQKKKFFMSFYEASAQGMEMLGSAMDMMSAANRRNTKEFQVLAAAQTIMAGSTAIMKTWQGYAELGPWGKAMAVAQIGMIGAQMGASLASIRSQSFADGGLVRGSGGNRDDKVPANLSPNEFVINASAVKKIGLSNLYKLNQGITPVNFRDGGSVMPVGVPNVTNGGSNVVVQILDQRTNDSAPIETQESVDSNGIRQIQVIVRDAVKKELAGGSLDQMMSQTYGISRKGIKR